MEKIKFTLDTQECVEFYVLEQTKLSGNQYILVTDTQEGDGEAFKRDFQTGFKGEHL